MPPIGGEALRSTSKRWCAAWIARELSELLKDDAWAILKELRYLRPTNSPERHKQVEREAEKKAIETARYVIPTRAFTSMVHTVSGWCCTGCTGCCMPVTRPTKRDGHRRDGRPGAGRRPDVLREGRPGDARPESALPEASFPRADGPGDAFAAAFDARLGGRVSRLRDWSSGAESMVGDAVRATFALPPRRWTTTRPSTG